MLQSVEKYSQNLIRDLDNAQTMICEQRNFWISGYKHNVNHMNQYRFHFFIALFLNILMKLKKKVF